MKTKAEQINVNKTIALGEAIVDCLECNINGTGLPCRSCRFKAIDNMIEYLEENTKGDKTD